MASLDEQITKFKNTVDKTEDVLTSGETTDVVINGKVVPSIRKQVKTQFDQALPEVNTIAKSSAKTATKSARSATASEKAVNQTVAAHTNEINSARAEQNEKAKLNALNAIAAVVSAKSTAASRDVVNAAQADVTEKHNAVQQNTDLVKKIGDVATGSVTLANKSAKQSEAIQQQLSQLLAETVRDLVKEESARVLNSHLSSANAIAAVVSAKSTAASRDAVNAAQADVTEKHSAVQQNTDLVKKIGDVATGSVTLTNKSAKQSEAIQQQLSQMLAETVRDLVKEEAARVLNAHLSSANAIAAVVSAKSTAASRDLVSAAQVDVTEKHNVVVTAHDQVVQLNETLLDAQSAINQTLVTAATDSAEANRTAKAALESAPALGAQLLSDAGFSEYVSDGFENITPAIVNDETDQALLAFDKLGRALLDLHPNVAQQVIAQMGNDYTLTYVEPESHSADTLFQLVDDSPLSSVLAMCDTSGNWHFSNSKIDYGVNLINRPVLYHFINDGQSQSLGQTAKPILTTESAFGANYPLMPSGGLRADDFSALVPLTEADDAQETPAGGMALGLYEGLKTAGVDVDSARFKFGYSCPGVAGTKIERYVEGGDLSEKILVQAKLMQSAAYSMGLDYQLHAYTWTLGGTDMSGGTTYQEYYDQFIAMHDWRESQLRERLGRPGLKLNCFVWQNGARSWVNNIDVSQAQVDAAKNHSQIHMVCPSYIFEYNDSVHLKNTSSKLLGYYMQRAYATVVIEEKQWKPLDIESATAIGQVITLNFDVPHPPLEFDTERLKPIANQGFHVEDDLGELTITDVQIVGGVSVQITVDRALDANPKVGYAIKYNDNGAANDGNHPRGHLRDSAGYTEKYIEPAVLVDGNPLEIPLHNWSLTFLKDIEV